MATIVKVGLDQWVIANNDSQTQLCTNGLSGCVALGLATDKQICLAHVFSNCTSDNWAEYKHQLELPLVVMRKNGSISEASLTYSEGTQNWLPDTLRNWLQDEGITKIDTYKSSGCRLEVSSIYGCEVYEYEADDSKLYSQGFFNTSNAAAYITNWGELSSNAAVAS